MARAPVADGQAFDAVRQSYAQYGGTPMQSMSPPQQTVAAPSQAGLPPSAGYGKRLFEAGEAFVDIDPSTGTATGQGEPAAATTAFGQKPLLGMPAGPRLQDVEAYTAGLVKGIPMVGAQRVGLDALQIEGANQMQSALSKLGAEYAALGERAAAGEEKYMQAFDKYRTGLGELAARGEQMRGARGVERQIEAQQTAAAQMAFDANRVYQDLSQSPMQTGALALAAGIVQGLQGYAGQDKPNAIIAAVQDAAQRDVANQMEQYKRMQAGQQVARNNFMEARQSLQDDQQALQVTAMATLDQISKGLDFIKARTLRAKDRADIEQAQGKIKMELGDAKVKLATDFANRSLTAAMANQREASDIAQKMINAREQFNTRTLAAQQKAKDRLTQFTSNTEEGQAMTDGLQNVAGFYTELAKMKQKGATDKEIYSAISQDFLSNLSNNLRTVAGNLKGADGSALSAAFQNSVAEMINNSTATDDEKRLRGMVANSYASYLRQTLGKSQTSPELVNARLVVDLQNPQSVLNFMDNIVKKSTATYQQQTRIDPEGAPLWYQAYGSLIDFANSEYNKIGRGVQGSATLFGK